MNRLRSALMLVATLVPLTHAPSQERYQPKPLPADAVAFTHAQYEQDMAKAWADLLSKECGLDALPKKAREPARELLTVYGSVLGTWSFLDDDRSTALAAVERLEELDVVDPVLQLATADLMIFSGRLEAAGPHFERATEGLAGRESAVVQFRLQHSLRDYYARIGQGPGRSRRTRSRTPDRDPRDRRSRRGAREAAAHAGREVFGQDRSR